MSNAYICSTDYLETATKTYSSQQAEFPASNLYEGSVRGRVWRSNGYWVVTSANKGIVFQTTGGVDVTANIAEGNYTSTTTFLAAIVTALNAASAGTYTATQHASSKKIVLTKSAGTFNLMATNVAFTAADLLGFSTAVDRTGALTYTADNVRIHTEEWLKFDLGIASNPDAFIAVGKKLQAIKISEIATLTLEGNATDSFSSPTYSASLTYDELALVKLKSDPSADGLHSGGLRYWRLKIVDRDNSNGYVELSNIFLGEYYTPTLGKVQFPLSINTVDYSVSTQLQYGAKSFTRRERTETFGFSWFPLTTTEKEVFDEIKLDLGFSKPFFMVFDPSMVIGSSVSYNTRFVRFSSEPNLSLDSPNIWRSDWQLEEML